MGKGMRAGKAKKQKQPNQAQQMQQIQAMQAQMDAVQEEINKKEIETTVGGGVVKVKVNGKKEVVALEIDPEVVDPDDVDTLQDLIIGAVNEGLRQIEEISNEEMEKMTGGLGLPPGML